VATIESAEWVGAVRAAFDGTVVAVNEMLIDCPTIAVPGEKGRRR